MFLKLGDIRGDSTHPDFMGWIMISDHLHWVVNNTVEIVTWSDQMRGALKALARRRNIPIANVVDISRPYRILSSYEGVKLISVADINDRDSPHERPSRVRLRVRFRYKSYKIWSEDNPSYVEQRTGPMGLRI